MNTSFQRTRSSDEWYTPPHIIAALGQFDLDPCAAPGWPTATLHYFKVDNGLSKPWSGRVCLNPPYSRPLVEQFVRKMAAHNNGVALTFNRMDSALWHDIIFPTASAMLILRGRLRFYRPDGLQGNAAGCGSVLVAWGAANAMALQSSGLPGKFILLNTNNSTLQTNQNENIHLNSNFRP